MTTPVNGSIAPNTAFCFGNGMAYYGFGTNGLEFYINGTDTVNALGAGGNGISQTMAFHMKEVNTTFVLASNDFDAIFEQIGLYFDMACYLLDNLPSTGTISVKENSIEVNIFPNPFQKEIQIDLEGRYHVLISDL
jgi:hypothetical protein